MPTISNDAALALKSAVSTRGPNKGRLLSKCPPSNTLAAAAWQAAMINVNPYKVSICALMFFSPEQRAIYREIDECMSQFPLAHRVRWDRDREVLTQLGAW
jgi:hypothetical protein